MVVEQLRYSGVLEVVRIRRQGYPVRLRFLKFVKQFEVLLSGSPCAMTEEEDYKDEKLLQIACAFIGEGYLEEDHYQVRRGGGYMGRSERLQRGGGGRLRRR